MPLLVMVRCVLESDLLQPPNHLFEPPNHPVDVHVSPCMSMHLRLKPALWEHHADGVGIAGNGSTPPPPPTLPVPASGDRLEGVAQELYRVVLFLVFYVQVYAISQLPYIGES